MLNMNFKYMPYSDELADMILKDMNNKSDSPSLPIIVATERCSIKDYEPIGVGFDVILKFLKKGYICTRKAWNKDKFLKFIENKNTFEIIRRYGVTVDYLMTDQDILANDWIIALSKEDNEGFDIYDELLCSYRMYEKWEILYM